MLRLQIVSTGEFLVLAADNVLTVEIMSTLFNNQDDFLGSFSYEGTMPLEPNKHLLRNAHLINTSVNLRTFDVVMYLGKLPYKQVQFTFSIEKDTVKFNLFIDVGIYARRLRAMKLNEVQDTNFNGRVLFNSRAELHTYVNASILAAPATLPMVFFPYKNDGAYNDFTLEDEATYPGLNYPIGTIINPWQVIDNVGSFLFDPDNQPQSQTFTPFFFLVYILKRIAGYFGCAATGKWLQDEHSKRITIASNIPMPDGTMIPDFAYFMPDMLVGDFLKAVRQDFGLLIDFDFTRKIALFESFENLETAEVSLDLTGKQLVGFRETRTTLKSYLIKRLADGKDSAFTDEEQAALPTIAVGDQTGIYEVEPVELGTVATKMVTELRPGSTATWRIPYIKQSIFGDGPFIGISSITYKDRAEFKPRFLYWQGMFLDSTNIRYPYGSADNLYYTGVPINNYTLALNNTTTAYLAVKRFVNFIHDTRPFEIDFICTPTEFARITPKTTVVVKDRNQATVKCLLDGATADIGKDDVIFAKATLYPFIRPNSLPVLSDVVNPGEPEPPGPDTIYVKLVKRNEQHFHYDAPPPPFNITTADIRLEFYSDFNGTVPLSVAALEVVVQRRRVTNGGAPVNNNFSSVCTGFYKDVLFTEVIYTSQGGNIVVTSFHVDASPAYVVIGNDITGGL